MKKEEMEKENEEEKEEEEEDECFISVPFAWHLSPSKDG